MSIAEAFKNFQFEAYLRIAKLCAAFRALPLLVAASVCNRAIQPTKSLRNVVLIIFNAAGRQSHHVVLLKGTNLKNRLKDRAVVAIEVGEAIGRISVIRVLQASQ